MATATQADFSATSAWANLVASNGATASVNILIQNKGDGVVQVVWGGSQPTSEDAGTMLKPMQSMQGNAAAIWLRTADGGDKVGVVLL